MFGIGLFITALFKTSRQSKPRRAALYLSLFSTVMLFTIIAMIWMREMQEPSATLLGYLSAPRYLLPIAVPWLGLVLAGLMLLSSRRASFVSVVSCLFAIGAIVAHRSYQSHVMAKAAPLHGTSHIQVWRNLVQIAREARVPICLSRIFRSNPSAVSASSISNIRAASP